MSPVLNSNLTDLPIVVASACDYPQEWFYADQQLRDRLVYLSDISYALTSDKNFEPEMSITIDQQILPFPVQPYKSFLEHNSRFYLLSSGSKNFLWTTERISREGWHLTTLARSGEDALYRVDRQ